jgi:hypothetical protein
VRAAREWGVPPLTILRGASPEWTWADRVLAVAAMLADDMRCGGCGQPKSEAWNPDSEGWYEGRQATCQGCAALARGAEEKYEPERKRWVEDTRPVSVELRPWDPYGSEVGAGLVERSADRTHQA